MFTNDVKWTIYGTEWKWCCFVSTLVCCVLTLQSELVDLAESIQQKLSYFNELENINTVGSLLSAASRPIIECLHYARFFPWLLINSLSELLRSAPASLIKNHNSSRLNVWNCFSAIIWCLKMLFCCLKLWKSQNLHGIFGRIYAGLDLKWKE